MPQAPLDPPAHPVPDPPAAHPGSDPPAHPVPDPPAHPGLQVLWRSGGPDGEDPDGAPGTGRVVEPDPAETVLAELYAHPVAGHGGPAQPWVRGGMVASVDGAVVGPDGSSRSLGTPADHRVLVLLRGLADVVLVGAGTARSEAYGLPRAGRVVRERRLDAGQQPVAALAVVTGSGDVPVGTGLFGPAAAGAPAAAGTSRATDDGRRAIVVTSAAAGPDVLARLRDLAGEDGVVVAGDDAVDLPRALDVLAERGLRRVLCEGGPALLGALAAAGRLDDLCLTTSPSLLAGASPRALTGPLAGAPTEALPDAVQRLPLRLRHLLLAPPDTGGGTVLARWEVSG